MLISRKPALVLAVFALVGAFVILAIAARTPTESAMREIVDPQALPELYPVPEFSLTASTKDSVSLESLRGKVWIADFIFTNCAGPCPMMTSHMAELHRAFKDDDRVRMVSFSVDPERDTPEVLAEYATKFGADTGRWHFLTGEVETIHELAVQGFKVGSLDNPIIHSDKFVLVDGDGIIRGYYTGSDSSDLLRLTRDVTKLLGGNSE
ncbi:MAG: SCO family protein [Candidatus Hydrogenedentota bacterium]